MDTTTPALVTDEIDVLQQMVPLAGATVAELGCDKAELARRLPERGLVARVHASEVDTRQHAANLAGARFAREMRVNLLRRH